MFPMPPYLLAAVAHFLQSFIYVRCKGTLEKKLSNKKCNQELWRWKNLKSDLSEQAVQRNTRWKVTASEDRVCLCLLCTHAKERGGNISLTFTPK